VRIKRTWVLAELDGMHFLGQKGGESPEGTREADLEEPGMGAHEHDDDLEAAGPVAPGDAARIADAIANGLERIATVLERGLQDLAHAMTSARQGVSGRKRSRGRTTRRR